MRKRRVLTLLIVLALCMAMIVGCSGNGTGASSGSNASGEAATIPSEGKDPPKDTYAFTFYYNYDYWEMKPWGVDLASKRMKDLFNIDITFSKPDTDADSKLNIMVSSDELPDVILMDRGPINISIARLGKFADLAPLQAKNPTYDQEISEATRNMLKIDGKLYGIPNWARKGATGGNDAWIYDKEIYEQAGSPPLSTFEELHAYALAVKNSVPKTLDDKPTIPYMVDYSVNGADKVIRPFYRSFGGPALPELYYTIKDKKIIFALESDVYKAAVLEANKWWREGLFSETQFTDSADQMKEKFTSGRIGLMFYDFSQDSVYRFRQLRVEERPTDNYLLCTNPVYPPANGLDPKKIYADEKATVGWNVSCISTKAKNPQRIFDWQSWMLTKEGSINMMYGPKGELWDELDKDGNPILKMAEADVSTEEKNRLGLWKWAEPGHSDNVDLTKFAVNAMQPPEKQDWVVTNQADVFSPIMFVTDELNGLADDIEQGSDLAIKKKLIQDTLIEKLPQVIMAKTAEEAEKLYNETLEFCQKNGTADVVQALDKKYQQNVQTQGFTAFDR